MHSLQTQSLVIKYVCQRAAVDVRKKQNRTMKDFQVTSLLDCQDHLPIYMSIVTRCLSLMSACPTQETCFLL